MSEAGEVNPCELCGGTVDHLWHVPEETWARISPRPHTPGTDDGGIMCVPCASRRAEEAGFTLYFHGGDIRNQRHIIEQFGPPPSEVSGEAKADPWNGCFSGDCPHETTAECVEGLRSYVAELEQENLRLRDPEEQEPVALGAMTPDGKCLEALGLNEVDDNFDLKGTGEFRSFWEDRPEPFAVVPLFTAPPKPVEPGTALEALGKLMWDLFRKHVPVHSRYTDASPVARCELCKAPWNNDVEHFKDCKVKRILDALATQPAEEEKPLDLTVDEQKEILQKAIPQIKEALTQLEKAKRIPPGMMDLVVRLTP